MGRPVMVSKDQILDAAERAFSERSYGETSLRQLIAEAGVSTTAFYARYESKEAVFTALVTRLMNDLFAAASKVLPSAKSPAEGIEVGIGVLVQALGRHPRVATLALSEGSSIPAVRDTMQRAFDSLVQLLTPLLPGGGEGESDDNHALTWALVGALYMQIVRWAVVAAVSFGELHGELVRAARVHLPNHATSTN